MSEVKAFVKDWKKQKVTKLVDLIKTYKVVGLLNIEHLPSNQLQVIKGKIRNEVLIRINKKSFILRALKALGYNDLADSMKGAPALILTNINPFKLYKLIDKNKSKSTIKVSQIAPFDLIIPAGETPFTPGPIIGELGSIGVKAKIIAGKISILKDAVVVKEGEPAGEIASTILAKLGIKPIEIGLNLVSVKEDDTIYTLDELSIDVEQMIMTAYVQAKNLVLNTGLIVKDLIEDILIKAQFNALMLNGIINPDQAIKVQAPSEEKKSEEKKEEEEEVVVSDSDAAAGLGALFG